MKFMLTFAEYSVVNAVRGLPPQAVSMLMNAKIGGHRTWVIEAEESALVALRETLRRETAISSGVNASGGGMLSRVVSKIDELIPPAPATVGAVSVSTDERAAKAG